MILKTLGVKGGGSYGRLISYILRDSAVLLDQSGEPVLIKHNLFGNPQEIEQQLKENESRRLHHRKNNNLLLHTILSLSERDKEHITPEILERLSREYINLLNPDGLYFGSIHMEGSPHAHILAGGVDLHGYSMRADLEKFQSIKQELQAIQMRDYPELTSSIAEHGSRDFTRSDAEYQIEHAGRTSRKEELKELLSVSFELAHSRDEFYSLLNEDGISIYERGGEAKGVSESDRNYRFSTLGLDMNELDIREQRLNELENIQEGKGVIQEIDQTDDLTMEEQRMRELDELGLS